MIKIFIQKAQKTLVRSKINGGPAVEYFNGGQSKQQHCVLKAVRMNNSKGFSLIEIIVVITIIGGILALAIPRLNFKQQNTKSVIRDLTIAVREIRNRAKLSSTSYRLAIQLTAKDGAPEHQKYWVEKSSKTTMIDKAQLEAEREEGKSNFRKNEDEKPPPKAFNRDNVLGKKDRELPDGYKFKLVESGSQEFTYLEGTAYIHFFPQGFIEPSLIQIEDPKKQIWTLVFNPITGQADVIDEAKTLKDISTR